MNAITNGFRASAAFVPKGMEPDFLRIRTDYTEAYLTPGAKIAEILIFEDLLKDAWNIFRIEVLIATLGEEQPNDPMNHWDFDKLDRTLTRTKTSFRHNLKRLADIQNTTLLLTFLPEEITKRTIPALANFRLTIKTVSLTKRTVQATPAEVANMDF
jgi:hypothetical protein